MFSLTVSFLVNVFVTFSTTVPDGFFLTPHGLRPSKCVVGVKSNNHKMIDTPTGLHIKYFDNEFEDEFYPVDPECVENAQQLGFEHAQRRTEALRAAGKLPKHHPLDPSKTQNNVEYTGGGWELYAGYYTTSVMGYFAATYQFPSTTPQTNTDQILYYFIGAQDNYDNNLTIIQPVATYAPKGNSNAATPGYSGTPWNCCPSGLSNYGTPIPAQENDIFNNYIATDNETGAINIWMQQVSTGQTSQLVLQQDYRQYDWIDITGEFYWDVGTCTELINSQFTFNNFTISTLDGTIQQPDWYVLEGDDIGVCNPQQSYSLEEATILAAQY